MTLISSKFADELCEKEARDAYVAAFTRTRLASQIRVIRSCRGWSQGEFAKVLGKPQSNVSRLESRDYGNFTLSTLLEVAAAFDVALVVKFASYNELLGSFHDLSPEVLKIDKFDRSTLNSLCVEFNGYERDRARGWQKGSYLWSAGSALEISNNLNKQELTIAPANNDERYDYASTPSSVPTRPPFFLTNRISIEPQSVTNQQSDFYSVVDRPPARPFDRFQQQASRTCPYHPLNQSRAL